MTTVRNAQGKFKYTDITGHRFGRLTVVALSERRKGKHIWQCKCDCGNTSYADISNLNNGSTQSCGCLKLEKLRAQKGSKHPNWQGGRVSSHHSGYIYIHKPSHPCANNAGYVAEHRLVMEIELGRYLLPEETVHHINGTKGDNRPENLELWSGKHPKGQRVQDLVKCAFEIIDTYGDIRDVMDEEDANYLTDEQNVIMGNWSFPC